MDGEAAQTINIAAVGIWLAGGAGLGLHADPLSAR